MRAGRSSHRLGSYTHCSRTNTAILADAPALKEGDNEHRRIHMAGGSIFDKFREAAGGALGNLTEIATTAAESAGLGDVVQQATDALGGATDGLGDVATQAGDAIASVTDQATEATTALTDKFTGGI